MNIFARHWGLFGVLAFWMLLLAINLLNLFPGVQFRGIRYHGPDFGQYYAAGVAASEGLWDEFYPDPEHYRIGMRPATAPYRPKMAAELERRGADTGTKNIYPPPTAILFAPLANWNYAIAQRRFLAFLGVCVICFLVLLYRECMDVGLSNRVTNFIVFFGGTGLPLTESVMFGNVTVLLGLSALLTLRGIRNGKTAATVIGFVVAGLTKGFSAAWTPALFIWKRWRIIVVGAFVAVLLLVLPFLLGGGTEVYREYISDVLPISRGNLYRIGDSNLGVPSFFAWMFHWNQVPRVVSRLFAFSQLAIIGLGYGFAWRASRRLENVIPAQCLALLVATITFQIFSTVCWPHYSVNILPFIPAAIAMAAKRLRSLVVLVVGFALTWFPVGNALKHLLGIYVFGFGRFFGYVILLAWSVFELRGLAMRTDRMNHRGDIA